MATIAQGTAGKLKRQAGMIGLLAIFALINVLAIRWLMFFNSTVTWWKIAIPVITVVGLLVVALHPQNLSAAPDSYQISAIFTALPAAGIVFSFLGFRTAIELAGKAVIPIVICRLR
ncbi:MAG: hypothetical protein PF501_02710 [Salinisphaera sp.]|jgi:amino acid transporter|nr:hypothetical protein [Salinisphaera sp.]